MRAMRAMRAVGNLQASSNHCAPLGGRSMIVETPKKSAASFARCSGVREATKAASASGSGACVGFCVASSAGSAEVPGFVAVSAGASNPRRVNSNARSRRESARVPDGFVVY